MESQKKITMKKANYLLIGTYTKGKSKGIHLYRFDNQTGDSSFLQEIEIQNPSYLTFLNSTSHIYSVSENEENEQSYVNALFFDRDKEKLSFLNSLAIKGSAPCYISTDKTGKHVITADYASGSISVIQTGQNGSLDKMSRFLPFHNKSINQERQERSHLHCVAFSPDYRYLFACDLGGDKLYRFEMNAQAKDFLNAGILVSWNIQPGSGPRHLAFHPSGKYLYLITELAGTVIVFKYNDGNVELLQTVSIDDSKNNECGDIAVTPDGKFLFASSRVENDGIAVFSINEKKGLLEKKYYINTGIHPRNIAVTSNGCFLLVANKDSNMIELYKINPATGELSNTHKDIPVDMPVFVTEI